MIVAQSRRICYTRINDVSIIASVVCESEVGVGIMRRILEGFGLSWVVERDLRGVG